MANETGALTLQNVLVRALSVDVVHQDRMLIFVGPRTALVDHRAGMCMSATRIAGPAITKVRSCAYIMSMVCDRLNVGIDIRIEMLARLPLVSGALNDVIQVRNNAGGRERLTMFVEVDAPGVAGA